MTSLQLTNSRQTRQSIPSNSANAIAQSEQEDADIEENIAYAVDFAFATTKNTTRNPFRYDTAATLHVCGERKRFLNFSKANDSVKHGNSESQIEGYGDISIRVETPTGFRNITITNVAYVPGFHFNILSAGKLQKQGLYHEARTGWLVNQIGEKIYKIIHQNNLFTIEKIEENLEAFATTKQQEISLDLWHERLGHIRKEVLNKLAENTVNLPQLNKEFERESELCRTCAMSNIKQQISRKPTHRGNYPFEIAHYDIIFLKEAFNAHRYVSHFYCAYSGFNISYQLVTKNEEGLIKYTKHFLEITKRWGFTTRILHTDNEAGIGHSYRNTIESYGIMLHQSPPYTQSQNGFAERSGGVIVDMARQIHISSQLPDNLWPEFITHATRLLNRLPIKRNNWIFPHEMRLQRKQLEKINFKALEGWLVGMQASNIFRVWIPNVNRIIVSRDVMVDEKIKYHKDATIASQTVDRTLMVIALEDLDDETIGQMAEPSESNRESEPSRSNREELISIAKAANRLLTPPTESSSAQADEIPEGEVQQLPTTLGGDLPSPAPSDDVEQEPNANAITQTNRKRKRDALEAQDLEWNVKHAFATAQSSVRKHRTEMKQPPEY